MPTVVAKAAQDTNKSTSTEHQSAASDDAVRVFGQTDAWSVAHSALHLVQHPAGGGGTRHVALAVHSHCSHRAHLPPTPAERKEIRSEGRSRRLLSTMEISHIWHSTGLASGAKFFLQRIRAYSVMRVSWDTSGIPMDRAN